MSHYWYCLKHHAVEPDEGCRNADRLGPYPTHAAAAAALERVAARNEAWENDPAWQRDDDWDDGDASDDGDDGDQSDRHGEDSSPA